jgi:predicted nucleic acid-binding protein
MDPTHDTRPSPGDRAPTHGDDATDRLWHEAREASARGSFRELEAVTTELSARAVRSSGEDSEANARALAELAYALRRQGNYAAAEPVLRRLVSIQERTLGPHHASLGLTLDLLAAAVSRAHPERMSEVKKLESRAAHVRLRRR